ncbi:twin-arginine translocation signal domain-containing protein [Agrobacterium leguminum]|uniref:twin-arginine translocation signal domain-containing protein n=1 Tax=Agrobacterium leguminum TaxID=2792015 RepID=UPI003CE496A5
MTYPVSRRSFLAASAAASAALLLPARVGAASDTAKLTATTRTIEVGGREPGSWGLSMRKAASDLRLTPDNASAWI